MSRTITATAVAVLATLATVVMTIPDADARRFGVERVNRVGVAGGSMRANRTVRQANRQDFRRDRWEYADDIRDDRREWADDRQRRRIGAYLTGAALSGRGCAYNPVMVGGMPYTQCGGQWYQPSYQNGTQVYITVNAPPGY